VSWMASCSSQGRNRGSRALRVPEDAHLQGRWPARGGRDDIGRWREAILGAKCFEKESRTRAISYHRVSSQMPPCWEGDQDDDMDTP